MTRRAVAADRQWEALALTVGLACLGLALLLFLWWLAVSCSPPLSPAEQTPERQPSVQPADTGRSYDIDGDGIPDFALTPPP